LLQHPDEAHRIAANGHRMVHEKFDWKSATDKLERLFSKNT
jgi:excinuclease UvrABC nuclease subunit